MIAIDLSKQQAFGAGPRAIQQISFTGILHCIGNIAMFFISEKANKTCFGFFTRNCKGIVNVLYNTLVLFNK